MIVEDCLFCFQLGCFEWRDFINFFQARSIASLPSLRKHRRAYRRRFNGKSSIEKGLLHLSSSCSCVVAARSPVAIHTALPRSLLPRRPRAASGNSGGPRGGFCVVFGFFLWLVVFCCCIQLLYSVILIQVAQGPAVCGLARARAADRPAARASRTRAADRPAARASRAQLELAVAVPLRQPADLARVQIGALVRCLLLPRPGVGVGVCPALARHVLNERCTLPRADLLLVVEEVLAGAEALGRATRRSTARGRRPTGVSLLHEAGHTEDVGLSSTADGAHLRVALQVGHLCGGRRVTSRTFLLPLLGGQVGNALGLVPVTLVGPGERDPPVPLLDAAQPHRALVEGPESVHGPAAPAGARGIWVLRKGEGAQVVVAVDEGAQVVVAVDVIHL